jgi:hypothetical protein
MNGKCMGVGLDLEEQQPEGHQASDGRDGHCFSNPNS